MIRSGSRGRLVLYTPEEWEMMWYDSGCENHVYMLRSASWGMNNYRYSDNYMLDHTDHGIITQPRWQLGPYDIRDLHLYIRAVHRVLWEHGTEPLV